MSHGANIERLTRLTADEIKRQGGDAPDALCIGHELHKACSDEMGETLVVWRGVQVYTDNVLPDGVRLLRATVIVSTVGTDPEPVTGEHGGGPVDDRHGGGPA